jgi:hypothetical protein
MIEQRILDAFQTMWGPFPERVMLVHKSRTVLAVNDLARSAGIVPGIRCFSLNPEVGPGEDQCKRCQASLALKTGESVCTEDEIGGRKIIGYWMPLKEVPDVYVHFAIGTAKSLTAKRMISKCLAATAGV